MFLCQSCIIVSIVNQLPFDTQVKTALSSSQVTANVCLFLVQNLSELRAVIFFMPLCL